MTKKPTWVLPGLVMVMVLLASSFGCQSPTSAVSIPTPEILSTEDVVKKVSLAVVFIVTDTGSGSGMFISSGGYVLTNEHVLGKGYQATLNLPDKRSIRADIIYRDPVLDIAILKGADGNYPAVTLGSTKEPMLGEDVIAFGFPSAKQLGDSVTVSKGIISAFRNIDGVKYIQSDVSLNPGSSGGPMANMYGEIIGMNTWKLSESEGIGFAIDINRIKMRTERILQQYIAGRLDAEKPPEVEWSKTFGGTGLDVARSVQQTSDGGYIIAGYTTSFGFGAGSWDVYLVKTDASGTMLWSKTFGGVKSDTAQSVQQTSDGGYIIAGATNSLGASEGDVYLVKTDSSGNMLWSKTFGGKGNQAAHSVQQTSDGGYIIAGDTNFEGRTDVYLVKTDSSGKMLWSKTFGGTGGDEAHSVQQTSDGGYIIAGNSAGSFDVYLVKTDALGNGIWQKTFGGPAYQVGYSVQQTTDGGYVVTGETYSLERTENADLKINCDIYLVKTDASGNILWSKTLGGVNLDIGYSVQQTTDGGYVIAGYTTSFGARGVYLVKTDASGTLLWSKTFGGTDSGVAYSVQQTSDGGYIIAASSHGAGSSDVYLIKLK